METSELSESAMIDFCRWLETRILVPRIMLLVLLLWGSIRLWATDDSPWNAAEDWFFLSGFVALFRLWDDLQDAELDRLHRPGHGLSDTKYRRALTVVLASGLIVIVAGAGLSFGWTSGILLSGLCGLLALWYRIRKRCSNPFVSYHLLLLKYPFILLTVALGRGLTGLQMTAAALCVYLMVCLWELGSESQLRSQSTGRKIAMAEGVLLGGSILFMWIME